MKRFYKRSLDQEKNLARRNKKKNQNKNQYKLQYYYVAVTTSVQLSSALTATIVTKTKPIAYDRNERQ
jgi:hypothetical protein